MATATMAARKRKPRGRLTRQQQELAERYLPMARRLARPMKRAFPNDWAELESAACLALVEAAGSFDPAYHVKFATFARMRIWGALQDVRRRLAPKTFDHVHRLVPPEFSSAPYDEGLHGRVVLCAEPEPVGTDLDSLEAIDGWLRKLPRGHAAACRQIYAYGKTHAEAAEVLGLSPSRVTYIHLEAMAMLDGTWEGKRPTGRRRVRAN